jgi:hypothetical protein
LEKASQHCGERSPTLTEDTIFYYNFNHGEVVSKITAKLHQLLCLQTTTKQYLAPVFGGGGGRYFNKAYTTEGYPTF